MSFLTAVTQWDATTNADAAAAGVDPNLVRAIMQNESGGRQYDASGNVLASPTGALGLMQLEPGTAAGLGVDPKNPLDNIKGGVAYIALMLKHFAGKPNQLSDSIAAYNAGPGAVDQYGGIPPYAETQAYVRNVAALLPTSVPSSGATPAPSATPNGLTDPYPNDNALQKWIYEHTALGDLYRAVDGTPPPAGGSGSGGGFFYPLIAGAKGLVLSVTIGALFLALVAGGFAVLAGGGSGQGPSVVPVPI